MATEGHRAAADLRVATATALGDHADLLGHRRGVLGVAGEHLDGQRMDPGIAQRPDDDLPLALFAVAVTAEGGPFIVDPCELAAGDNRRGGVCVQAGTDSSRMLARNPLWPLCHESSGVKTRLTLMPYRRETPETNSLVRSISAPYESIRSRTTSTSKSDSGSASPRA